MTKRLNNPSVYRIEGGYGVYIVILKHLKNTKYGNPRFNAIIVNNRVEITNPNYMFGRTYNFDGHYIDEYNEAKWIVNRMEKEIADSSQYL